MKVFNIIFCVLFVFSAALQYNDPDPFIWIPIYLCGALFCWLAARGSYYPKGYLAVIAIFMVYAVYLFVEKDGVWDWITRHNAENIATSMKASTPWIEDTREFFGLAILIGVLLANYIYARKRKRVYKQGY